MDESLFRDSLEKCSKCGLPILEGADKLIYVTESFSFAKCTCDLNGGPDDNRPSSRGKTPHHRDRESYGSLSGMPDFARENGRYGSAPSEDDYSDESDS